MDIKTVTDPLGAYSRNSVDGVKGKDRKTGESSGSRASPDRVSVSDEGRIFSSALQEAQSTSDVRTDKVNRIREMIQNGEYHLDTKRIAQKLVESDSELWTET